MKFSSSSPPSTEPSPVPEKLPYWIFGCDPSTPQIPVKKSIENSVKSNMNTTEIILAVKRALLSDDGDDDDRDCEEGKGKVNGKNHGADRRKVVIDVIGGKEGRRTVFV